jgi:chemotaxis protein methyltransferase CheR
VTSTFEALRQFLYERSGLSLEGDKLYLVESRLLPIAREFGLADLPSLLKRLQTGDRDLAQAVVEAMTTNETFFFRDRVPFDKFRSVILPELLAARAAERRLRIWCAACSTGQEPYSLAMLLDEEARRFTGWSVGILATDLSRRAIETARRDSTANSRCSAACRLPCCCAISSAPHKEHPTLFVHKAAQRQRPELMLVAN